MQSKQLTLTRPVLRSRQPPLHRPDSPLYNPTRQRGAAAARSAPPNAGADDGYDPKAKGKGNAVATRAGGYQALPPDEGQSGGGGGGGDDFLALDMGGGRSDQFMQMQLMENGEVRARYDAIKVA